MSYVKTVWVNGVTKVNATNQNNNENATAQLSDFIEPDSVVSQLINITTDSPTASIINLKITTTVTGGAITINRNGAGAKALLNPDGSAVTELDQDVGYFKVVEETSNFILAPKGGSSFGAYVKFPGLNTLYDVSGGAISNFGDATNTKVAQTFTTPSGASSDLFDIDFYLDAFSNPADSVKISIFNTSGGLPTGSAIAVSDNTVLGSTIQASPGRYTFTFSGVSLNSGTLYALVVERTGTPGDPGQYRYARNQTNPYPNGQGMVFSSGSWFVFTGDDLNARIRLGQPQATLQTDGKDTTVKTGQYILANNAVFIDDGASGQTIPSVDDATSESQLQATVSGTLKTDTSYTTARQVIASIFKNSQGFTTL